MKILSEITTAIITQTSIAVEGKNGDGLYTYSNNDTNNEENVLLHEMGAFLDDEEMKEFEKYINKNLKTEREI